MFTALYQGLTSQFEMGEKCDFQVLLETMEITSRSIEMFVSQCDLVNKSSDNDTKPAKTFENYFKLLSALDKYLNEMISLSMEDMFNTISWSQYSNEQINSKKYLLLKNKVLNKINAMDCLFTWDLPIAQKDIICHIKKKYCHFNLDISTPVFTFERYISNLIIGYELFLKEKKETAKIVILLIGKWLEELDNSADELYLSIRDGLKNVLTATFIHMKMKTVKTKMANHIKWLMNINMKYSDMNDRSKAVVHAIHAAVLLEYSDSEDCFMEANECAETACNLDPTFSYWFYLHSLVLTAQRRFLYTKKSYTGVKENKAIQQAIKLSDTLNIYIKYHEIILLKDDVLYNFYSKNYPSFKHVSDCKKIISMIKTLVNIEPNDPLVVVNCARILMSLPDMIPDINYGKKLLLKGIQMAPNDLAVLKAITQAIIVCKKKIFKCENFSIITCQSPSANKQINLANIMKSAVEKHIKNEDPVPYLLSLLKNNNNNLMQWKILAQICSYVVLFQGNIEDGVKYFKLLVEAVQKEKTYNYLILSHSSLFTSKPKSFNLAELIRNEIKIALKDDILDNKPYYYNVLTTILLIYCIDSKDNVDRSYRLNIIGKHRHGNEQFDIQNVTQTLNETNKRKSRKRSRSRNHRINRNNTIINSTENEVKYEDDSDDDNDDRNLTINDVSGTDDSCCRCMIM